MINLKQGNYFGSHYLKSTFEDVIITDTEYTHPKVDWHYHENPYFTFLLQGKVFEANKKESYYLKPGNLLFHNWQDAHYNIKPNEFTRGFHIELNTDWFNRNTINLTDFEGSFQVENPKVKSLITTIFIESKINDAFSKVSLDFLLMDIFNHLSIQNNSRKIAKPDWVNQLKMLLMDDDTLELSANAISLQLGIHPVHLSRTFHSYFGMSFGEYIRYLKLSKALDLMLKKTLSLTEISQFCGFYDQSHFISCFKRIFHMTPLQFLKKYIG